MCGSRRSAIACALLVACGQPSAPGGPACSDPPRGPATDLVRDVTATAGVEFAYVTDQYGGGLAAVDLDGDGLPELVLASRSGGNAVFHNVGGMRFERATTGIDPALGAHAIGAADLDNDGDVDLVLAGANATHVFANQGDGTFVEAALLDGSGITEHVLTADLDGDGVLDLYLSNYDLRTADGTTNRFYYQRGALQFAPPVLLGAGLSWATTWFDYDDDGDGDLYVANDTLLGDPGDGTPPEPTLLHADLLLRNDGLAADGTVQFTDVAGAAGLATPRSSMGGLVGDWDADGRLDLYVPDLGADKLFVRDADGRFVDHARELGVAAPLRDIDQCVGSHVSGCMLQSWSASATDLDLDGFDELVVANGTAGISDIPPLLLFTRDDAGPYRELSSELGCLNAHSLVVTDLDGDGDQDLVVAPADGAPEIYEVPGVPAPTTWLRVALRGRTSNRDGAGAVVTVQMASGRVQTRLVAAGGSVHSAAPAEAFFGLGDDAVERIVVAWPSGHRTERAGAASGALVLDEND